MTTEQLAPSLEKIGQLAVDRLHEDFDRIWVRCRRMGGGNELMMVFQPRGRPGCYKDASNDTPEDTRIVADLSQAFQDLWECFRDAREEPWGSVTLIFDDCGKFTCDFGYEDFDRISPSKWRTDWEKKHLGNLMFIE